MLRKEFAIGRPTDVPDAPTHAARVAAKAAEADAQPEPDAAAGAAATSV